MLNHKKVERILEIILEGLIYLSFLMPFIFINNSIFPFIVGKILYFQGLVQLMAVIYALLLIVNFEKYRPAKNILFYWFIFYAATLFLSAVFGIDFDRSFWSNFERMTGVFVTWHFIAYAIMVSAMFRGWSRVKRAIQVLLAASLIQVAVVAAQYVKPGVFLYENKGGRVWGTLGNSIYIGSYFLFHIFFAGLLALKEKKQLMQIFYIVIAVLEAYIIVHSESSRGADLALLGGAVFIVFAYALLSGNKKIRAAVISFLGVMIILFAGLVVFRESGVAQKIPVVRDLVKISLKEGTGRTRAIAWGIAWQAFPARPILGWGQENFYYVFNKYYNPESLRYSYYETWFDRSHSILFDTLVNGGVVGFISYFGLYAAALALLFGRWRKNKIARLDLIFFSVILGSYIVQNLFVFEHPASYLLIYFSFGLILGLLGEDKKDAVPKYGLSVSLFWFFAAILGILFLIIFFGTSIKTYRAALGIIKAESIFVKDYRAGLSAYKELLSMNTPFIEDMRSTMAKRTAMIADSQVTLPDYDKVLLFAREELSKQAERGDRDVYDYILLGQIDMLLSRIDGKYLRSADDSFARALELSPRRQQIYYTWAKLKMMGGDMAGAIDLLERAAKLDDKIADSYWYLGLIYVDGGKNDLAWNNIQKAVERRYSWKTTGELSFAIDLGKKLKKYGDLPYFYEALLGASPTPELYRELAGLYLRLGQKDKADEVIKRAVGINANIFK